MMIEALIARASELYAAFTVMAQSSPVVAGAVSLWGLSVITYLVRGVPMRVYGFFKRQLTTTLIVSSQDHIYYKLLKWVSEEKMNSLVRTLSFKAESEGSWNSMITMGYGNHWFMHGGKIVHMSRVRQEANQTAKEKETVYLTTFGRSHKAFDKIFETLENEDKEDKQLRIYTWQGQHGYWSELCRVSPRPIDTVSLPQVTKDTVTNHLESFWNDKEWYLNAGIPWRTGIMLYGPPGTGKTSFIKALCSKYEKNLFIIDLNSHTDKTLLSALNQVPTNAIAVIEDIDTMGVEVRNLTPPPLEETTEVHRQLDGSTIKIRRTAAAAAVAAAKNPGEEDERLLGPSLSGILNAIDGAASMEGRIIVATSNDFSKLDSALLREGRFDLKVELGYMTDESFRAYMSRLYPHAINEMELETWTINPGIAPCAVQKLVFENRQNPLPVLQAVATQLTEKKDQWPIVA